MKSAWMLVVASILLGCSAPTAPRPAFETFPDGTTLDLAATCRDLRCDFAFTTNHAGKWEKVIWQFGDTVGRSVIIRKGSNSVGYTYSGPGTYTATVMVCWGTSPNDICYPAQTTVTVPA